jgi:hypothetical protein
MELVPIAGEVAVAEIQETAHPILAQVERAAVAQVDMGRLRAFQAVMELLILAAVAVEAVVRLYWLISAGRVDLES